jgi:ABC-type transport system substrate-binding protein
VKLRRATRRYSFEFHYASDSYGASYQAYATALAGELQNAGMKVDRKPAPYQTSFFPSVGKGQGQFTGFGIQAGAGQGSPQEFIRGYYHSQGAFGVDAPPFSAEPDVDKLISDMKLEFDAKKLIEMQKEFQRFMAKRMRMILDPGNVPSLSLTWPWVGNAGVYRPYDSWAGQGTEHTPYLWHDASKKS